MAIIDDIKNKFNNGTLSIKLIYINVAVFLVLALINLFDKNRFLLSKLSLVNSLPEFIKEPWTIFTYMFVHIEAMHLIFNMLMLWVVGDFFYKYFGDKAFGQFYFLGGIFGGIFYFLLGFFIPHSHLMGASAAIYSVLFAMVAYQPELKVRLMFVMQPVKLMYVAIGFILLGFLFNKDNLGGNISHVGGALFGYFYMKRFEKGDSFWDFFVNLFSNFKLKKKPKLRAEKVNKPPRNDDEYADWKKQKEDRTNQILEKISRSGYNSLTDEEKAFLFKQRRK